MEITLTKEFARATRDKPEHNVLIEAISHYIEHQTLPDEWFKEEIQGKYKFQYFCRVLRDSFNVKHRKIMSHPALFPVLLKHGIKDEEVLHWYIWEFLGFDIPRVCTCKLYNPDFDKLDYPHCAPFDYVRDMFFEHVRNSIAFANRTGGKTTNVAILNHLDMTFKEDCEVASAGAILMQADKVYRYFLSFHKHDQLKELYEKDPTKSMTIYKNGSIQEVITGSMKGLNSPHPQKGRIDEVELMEWGVLQESLSMSVSKNDIMGQMTFLCVAADTVLWPADPLLYLDIEKGKREYTVKDLFCLYSNVNRKRRALLFVVDEKTGKFHMDYVKKVWRTKRDKVYKIKYKALYDEKECYSNTQKTTIDHLILMQDCSWKEVGKLSVGDRLFFGGGYKDPPYAEFVGIEYHGVEDVYEIMMEKYVNFVADEGIVLHNSTRKWDSGTFQRLLDESDATGMKIYCWCIWEILEKCLYECKNDPKHGNCPIFDKCKGMAHYCSGYYKIDDWVDKARMINVDILDAQWFNKKPSQEAIVYGGWWDKEVHFKPSNFRPEGDHIIGMSAIDFGASPGHPFVYQKCWVDYSDVFRAMEETEPNKDLSYKLLFYIFYEYRSGSATMAQHSEMIKASPEFQQNEIIFADPSAKQSRIDLLEIYNIETYAAINAVEDGIDMVRNHLETWKDYGEKGGTIKSWLYILEDYLFTEDKLMGSDAEFAMYRYSKSPDGRLVKRQPMKIYDHGMDCIRYTIQSAYQIIAEIAIPPMEIVEQEGYWSELF